jgi:hypothetical protein
MICTFTEQVPNSRAELHARFPVPVVHQLDREARAIEEAEQIPHIAERLPREVLVKLLPSLLGHIGI